MVLAFDCMQTYKEQTVNGIPLVLTHGHHYNKQKPFAKAKRHVLLNGHFHVPEAEDCGNFVYINVGSVSIPKQSSPHAYAVLEGAEFSFKDVETGRAFQHYIYGE